MQEDDYQLIDQYLANQLAAPEREAVEARLLTDPAFAEALQLRREMDQLLGQEKQREQLRGRFAELGGKYFSEEAPSQPKGKILGLPRRQWLVAASVALIIVAGALLLNQLQRPLYERYNDHPPLALTEKSGEAVDLSGIERAFNSGRYQEAADGLDQYLTDHPEDQTAMLYRGIAALELEQYDTAVSSFEAIRATDTDLRDYGTWYLALTYLRRGDRERCRALLGEIPPGTDLRARADSLLQDL